MASAAARHLKYQKVEMYGSSGLGYVAARDLVREKGGLASALLVDNYFLGERTLPSKPADIWMRDVMVYPKIGDQFDLNKDIIDTRGEKIWVFPSSCIPKSALKKPNVLLVVDPDEIEVTSRTVTVLSRPEKVVVLSDLLEDSAPLVLSDQLSSVSLRFLSSCGAVAWSHSEKLLRYNSWGVRYGSQCFWIWH